VCAQDNISIDTNSFSVEQLVSDILIQSQCAEIENVTFTGRSSQIGYFSNGMDAVQMEDGIILSTGSVKDAVGPNSRTGTATDFFDGAHVGDADLGRVANENTNFIRDDAIIEFDFTPLEDYIEFQFVFASEEYCDFAGPATLYNDVFGFFLSGPGISGPYSNNATNIATSPGSNDNITVKNINHNLNYDFFIDNTPQDQLLGTPEHYDNCRLDVPRDGIITMLGQDGASVSSLEYDGYTVILTAGHRVVPMERYHLKLGIADVQDGIWDSAVFLKAGSFKAGQPTARVANPAKINCDRDPITLDGNGSSAGSSFSYEWTTIDGNIVSGDRTLSPVVDKSGTYTLMVSRAGTSCVASKSVLVENNEEKPRILGVSSFPLSCDVDETAIHVDIAQPDNLTYKLQYPSGAFSPVLNHAQLKTTHGGMHVVYAIASSGCEDRVNHMVALDTFSGQAIFHDNKITCLDDELHIIPDFEDHTKEFTFSWTTSDGHIISGTDELDILIDEPGTYVLHATQIDNQCTSRHELLIENDREMPIISAGIDMVIPCRADEVALDGIINNPTGSETINWIARNGSAILPGTDPLRPIATAPGIYVLSVVGDNGCEALDSVMVDIDISATVITLAHADTLTCSQDLAEVSVLLDSHAEEITWSTTDGKIEVMSADQLTLQVSEPGWYTMEVVNKNGCISSLVVEIVQALPPIIDAGDPVDLDCKGMARLLAVGPSDQPIEYTWYPSDNPLNRISNRSISVDAAGTYVVEAINIHTGCMAMDSIVVKPSLHQVDYELTYSNCVFDAGRFRIVQNQQQFAQAIIYKETEYEADEQIDVRGLEPVLVRLNSGCVQEVSLDYIVSDGLTVELTQSQEAIIGEPFLLSGIVNRLDFEMESIQWIGVAESDCADCLDQTLTLSQPAMIELIVTDAYGCTERASIRINPKSLVKVFIPTAFSPNDDRINDELEIFANEYVEGVKSMRIFNRWGNQVFGMKNDSELSRSITDFTWDGYTNDKESPDGIYLYSISIVTTNGEVIDYNGELALLR